MHVDNVLSELHQTFPTMELTRTVSPHRPGGEARLDTPTTLEQATLLVDIVKDFPSALGKSLVTHTAFVCTDAFHRVDQSRHWSLNTYSPTHHTDIVSKYLFASTLPIIRDSMVLQRSRSEEAPIH